MSNIAEEFQKELNSIIETKPPISKAKMNSIVKAAIKSVKHYKHVVYYVENFIKNCESDYKIAGLYVIDAIIRHSRYQYLQNDLFAPRFAKNLYKTFVNLYRCPANEQEKIKKVLQLWQKNNIFSNDLIDKLTKLTEFMSKNDNINDYDKLFKEDDNKESDKLIRNDDSVNGNSENVEQIKKLKQLQKNLLLENKNNVNEIDNNLLTEIHKITSELLNKPTNDNNNKTSANNYNNEDADNTISSDNNKDLELETLIVENKRFEDSRERLRASFNNCSAWLLANDLTNNENDDKNNNNNEQSNQNKLNNFIPPDLTKPPPPIFINQLPNITNQQAQMFTSILQQSANNSTTVKDTKLPSPALKQDIMQMQQPSSTIKEPRKDYSNNFGYEEHQNKRFKRSKSEEKSESSFSSVLVAANSATLDPHSNMKREDIERTRRKKALPPIKENHLSICSKTLWIGHLAKTTTESDLKEIVETYGPIIDIHMIPPRGCAYIQFSERRDAAKCLDRLKDSRIQGSFVKIEWAHDKSIKDKLKNYWNVDFGCTYIPWKELNNFENLNFMTLSNGGFIDEDTIPENLLNLYNEQMNKTTKVTSVNESESTTPSGSSVQRPNSQQEAFSQNTREELMSVAAIHNLESMKDLFDPSRPPPLMQFPPQQDIQQAQQSILLSQLQAQPNGLPLQFQTQQILLPENEIAQSHQQQNIGLLHAQQNANQACFLNQIRGAAPPPPPPPPPSAPNSAAAFATGSQLHQLQNHQPGGSNIHLMPLLAQTHLQSAVTQSHLKNQVPTQQSAISHGLSGLPLQVLQGNMLGPHPTALGHQTRPAFHLSPQVQFLQRPIITQQGHLIQAGLIRQLIPGALLQQFQQPDLNDLNVNENNSLNNTNQVQLVALANRSLTPTNQMQNIQIRHLTPANPTQLQTAASVLSTQIHQQQQQQQQLGQDRQFNNNQNNNNTTAANNNNDTNYKNSEQSLNHFQSKLNQPNIEAQFFNESLLFNDVNNRFNIPCLMNMNFNPASPAANANQVELNNMNFSNLDSNNNNSNNTNAILNYNRNKFENNFNNNNNNNEYEKDKRKTSRFDRDWSSTPTKLNDQYRVNLNQISHSNYQQSKKDYSNNYNNNQNDRNRNFDYRQRNNNFINKKTFNSNNGWNKTWRSNNYHLNKYQNSRNVNSNNNFNETIQQQLITSNLINSNNNDINESYALNDTNIEDMCTSDDDNLNSNNNRNNENKVLNENNDES